MNHDYRTEELSKVSIDTGVDAVRQILHDHGLQATSARVAVLQILGEEHHHLSVEELRAAVLARYPTIDPATVYRTLETLHSHGLVVRMELGDKRTRWSYSTHEHHHLVCRVCGAVVQIEDSPVQLFAEELARIHGLRLDAHHLVLSGLCATCASES